MIKNIENETYSLSNSWIKNKKKWRRKKKLWKKFLKYSSTYVDEYPEPKPEIIKDPLDKEEEYISPALKRIEQKVEEAKRKIDERKESSTTSHENNDYTSRYIFHQ